MLTALELENFKAFGVRNRIEFAPITLVFGENSAGKSTILQALNLLKQTRESREHGALLLPRSENGIVDLGGYREMIFDHDMTRELTIRVECADDGDRRVSSLLRTGEEGSDKCGVEMCFARPSEDVEIGLKWIDLDSAVIGRVARFEPVSDPGSSEHRPIGDSYAFSKYGRGIRESEVRTARCTWLTEDVGVWNDNFERTKRRASQIAMELRELQRQSQDSGQQRTLFDAVKKERLASTTPLEDALRFYESDFGLAEYISRMRQAELNAIVGMDGFVPVPLRHRFHDTLPEFETSRRFGPSRLRIRELTLDVAGYAVDCGRMLESMLESIYPMGPFRRPPERWYIFTGTSPQDVGYRGDLLPDLLFRRPELVQETNEWLDRLEVGYHIKVQSVGIHSRDLFEVRLIDKRRSGNVDVALSDVGFGVSQLLPFVVQSLAGQSQIITIEQPEVHIHPRLQADLGDLLISTIREPRTHSFIVETHSEHLILRLLRRIRETTDGELPDGHPGLRAEQVSVIYLERGFEGTHAHRLRIDDTGEFVDRWPKGFFEERAKELF